MKIEKEKKRVFQVFFDAVEVGKPKYEIVFANSKAKAVEGFAKIITKVKELKL